MVADDIFFCRHGQTDYNAEERFQGQREVPLNAMGRSQARRNGTYLRNKLGAEAARFRFVASPLGRSRETMRIVRRELGLDPESFEIDDRLVEVGYGDWEGSTLPEISNEDPTAVEAREADKWNYRCPGGNAESYADLYARVSPLFESLTAETIVVSHGGIGRAALHHFGKTSREKAATTVIPQDRILTFDQYGPRWV